MKADDIAGIRQMRDVESAMEYIYDHNITPRTIYDHLEELRGLFDTEYGFHQFLQNQLEMPQFLFASERFPNGQRLGLFLHPRFLPDMPHAHDYYEIKYMLQGETTTMAEGVSIPLKKGDLCFISPNTVHQTLIFESDVLLMNIEVRAEEIVNVFSRVIRTGNMLRDFLLSDREEITSETHPFLVFHTEECPQVRELVLAAYHAEAGTSGFGKSMLMCESYVEQILLLLLQCDIVPDERFSRVQPSNTLAKILLYTKKHLDSVRLAELAEQFHYSEAYLSRMIRNHTSRSFKELITGYRINEAARLLLDTNLSIDEVMQLCGYAGRTNFHNLFRKRYGESPAEYRKNHKRKPDEKE